MPADPKYFEIDGNSVRITHLDKVMFPSDGTTKAEIVQYYLDLADVMLPHVSGRPVTIKAWPHGIEERPYYRRKLAASTPAWVSRFELNGEMAPVIRSRADLMWVVNQDSIEIHTWLSRTPDEDHPDQLLFDLDPGTNVDNDRLCEAALALKHVLDQLGLTSVPKTSGSKGFHVLVGIEPKYDFEMTRGWMIGVTKVLADHRPDLFTIGYSQRDRVGRVLLDYNQVGHGRTTASIYSVRPLPGAPISAPVSWDEIERREVSPQGFNIANIGQRLEEVNDVGAPLITTRQELPHL